MRLEQSLLDEDVDKTNLWQEDSADLLGQLSPVWEIGLLGMQGMQMGEEIGQQGEDDEPGNPEGGTLAEAVKGETLLSEFEELLDGPAQGSEFGHGVARVIEVGDEVAFFL